LSRKNARRALLWTTVSAAGLILSLSVGMTPAQAQSYNFDIPAQSLAASLRDYARVSGQQIIFTNDLVAGYSGRPLHGSYSPGEALSQLLAGTGLVVERSPSGALMVRRERHAAADEPVLANVVTAAPQGSVAADETPKSAAVEQVVVVGTHIQGARATEALPVTVISPDQIAATGAVTGDDLFRSIPSMGNVSFNAQTGPQTSNTARGDVASINLRGSGIGDTLVLVNGRRIASYPASQSQGNIPLITYNAQALPPVGIQRVEVLRGGAGAIYGSDAVAGVVNFVTKTDFEGVTANGQFGIAQGTHRMEYDENIFAGHNFDGDRGNVSVSLDLYQRSAQLPSDEPYTTSQDLRPFFANTPGFSTSSTPDLRGSQSSFATLAAKTAAGGALTTAVKQGAVSITTAAGSFHIQPSTLAGCVTQTGNGLCIGTGTVAQSPAANTLRYDSYTRDSVTIAPSINRQNGNFNAHYDLSDNLTVYTELDYYHAVSHGVTTQPTALVAIGVPASNYFNPLGPVTFANGTANPNRLPNLTNVPASGLPVTFATYRFNDFGPDHVDVDSYQDRFLVGLKGRLWGFDWDSALLYGQAQATDTSDGIDSTLLANQLALSTPDAYNPFNGGCLDGSGGLDCTPSSQAALDAARIRLKRVSTTSLTNFDFKVTKSDLFDLPAGHVGIALGFEGRREAHSDTRDPHINGTINFTDPVLQTLAVSDATGVSDTPNTRGSRTVYSTYAELAVPVISSDMGIPLVQKVNVQLAGRFENYSDFGNVTKPKAAIAWDVIDGVRLRASWEQGFKAPNLETTSPFTFSRAQSVTDWYRCQAALNKGTLANFSACTFTNGITYAESGNPQLQPETSESYDFGAVLQPTFIPDFLGSFTITADRWRLLQTGIVGVISYPTIAVQDYLSRQQGGPGSPSLIRAAPTVDDVAFYAGSGLAPAGVPVQVNDKFQNLQPQTISGVDLSVAWNKATEDYGSFSSTIDVTYLDKFFQPLGPELQALYAARAAGTINAATPLVTAAGNQVEANGNPRWKGNFTLTWNIAEFQVGASVIYTGNTLDTNFLSTSGAPFRVASLTTANLYGQYTFEQFGPAHDIRIKVGARNLFDQDPPIESDGYNGALYQPYGRFLYINIGTSF
jgi:iron complex outermembrane receptor protein